MEPPNIDVSVVGFFNQKISFKSGEVKTPAFKVYNAVQAFFTDATKMIDFKAGNGKVYHLDRREMEAFLGAHVNGNDAHLAEHVIDQLKNDHLTIRNIKDLRRITSETGRSFKTLNDQIIRLYDNFRTYDNKQRVDVHNASKSYLYVGKPLNYNIYNNWNTFRTDCKDQTIIVNKEDLQRWFHNEIFSVLVKEVGLQKIVDWAIQSKKYPLYSNMMITLDDLFEAVFRGAFEYRDVICLNAILETADSILQFNKASDLKLEEERIKKEKDAEIDFEKAKKENAGYQKVLEETASFKGPLQTKNYRSYDMKDGKQGYVLSEEESKLKREQEEENLKYKKVKEPVEDNPQVEPLKSEASPKRHVEGGHYTSENQGPLDKSKGPKRH